MISSFYSTSTELCLACSGSAISGSQRPRPISEPLPGPTFSSREHPSTQTAELSSSTSGPILDDCSKQSVDPGREVGDVLKRSIFRTQCCDRPICSACLTSNPRLARYVPCIACLGGVRAVAGPSSSASMCSSLKRPISDATSQKLKQERELDTNLSGALRDRDDFVLGDDDDDDDDVEYSGMPNGRMDGTPPPAYSTSGPAPVLPTNLPATDDGNGERGQQPNADSEAQLSSGASSIIDRRPIVIDAGVERPDLTPILTPKIVSTVPTETATTPTPRKHYIQKSDTLRGLALRYGIDGRVLCRLNNLPPSTLTTTPHLLHTRTTLILPPSAKFVPPGEGQSHEYDPERERQIKLEKTAKRLQLITKEADWNVAKAYSVLAQSSSSTSSSSASLSAADICTRVNGRDIPVNQERLCQPYLDEKSAYTDDKQMARKKATMQERALDAYFEDNAWEARERAAGRGPSSSLKPQGPRPSSNATPTSTLRHSKLPTGQTVKTKNSKWSF